MQEISIGRVIEAARYLKEETSLIWISGQFQNANGDVLDILHLKKLLSSKICNNVWTLGISMPEDANELRMYYIRFANDLKSARFRSAVITYCKSAYDVIDPL